MRENSPRRFFEPTVFIFSELNAFDGLALKSLESGNHILTKANYNLLLKLMRKNTYSSPNILGFI
jgi:hypothetical protein